jgi:hypothetical protein
MFEAVHEVAKQYFQNAKLRQGYHRALGFFVGMLTRGEGVPGPVLLFSCIFRSPLPSMSSRESIFQIL